MAVSTTNKKTWWSRLIMGLNNLMNPGHAWRDYENDPDASSTFDNLVNSVDDVLNGISTNSSSIVDRLTQAHQTGAEVEAQEFSANEAEKSRNFTEYMARNKYQMETQSMQQSGINPAMVYGGGNLVPTAANGAQGTPSAPGSSALNPFDLFMMMARMSRELKLLDSQKANIDSDTEKNKAEAEKIGSENKLLGLELEWFPKVKESEIKELNSITDLNKVKMDREEAETQFTKAKTVLQEIENKYADQYFAFRNALEDATAKRELSRKALNDMQTAMFRIEKEYMEKYDMKMASNEAYSIVMALMDAFGLGDPKSAVDGIILSLDPNSGLGQLFKDLFNPDTTPVTSGSSIGGGGR